MASAAPGCRLSMSRFRGKISATCLAIFSPSPEDRPGRTSMKLNVNGRDVEVQSDPATPLLYVLRDELQLNRAKFGCGLGQCGACTVLADGNAIFSCLMPISVLASKKIVTV